MENKKGGKLIIFNLLLALIKIYRYRGGDCGGGGCGGYGGGVRRESE